MKDRIIQQINVIDEADPQRFQEQVNAALLAHKDVDSINYYNRPGALIAIVTYTEKLQEIETAEDYFAVLGKHYLCNDCSCCELDPDRRSVTHYCRKHRDRVRLKDPACEWFLTGLKAGELHLVTPEERRAQYDRMDAEELERRKKRQRLNEKASRARKQAREQKAQEKKQLPQQAETQEAQKK